MRKLLKSRLFFFILGALIFGSISAVFAYSYISTEVGFTPMDAEWNVDNTKTALEWLYTKKNTGLLHSFSTYLRAATESNVKAAEATFDFNKDRILKNYKYFKVFDAISNSNANFCTYYAWSDAQQKLVQLTMNQSYLIASTTDGYRFISLVVYTTSKTNGYQATCNVGFTLYN